MCVFERDRDRETPTETDKGTGIVRHKEKATKSYMCKCLWRQKISDTLPGVTRDCKMPSVGAGNHVQIHWSYFFRPKVFMF